MLAKCANPSCSSHFRYLENGTLFRLESDPRYSTNPQFREYFWLCRACSATLTLKLDENGTIRVASLGNPPRRGEDGFDFILLDRDKGLLLSRIKLFHHRGRRREEVEGGQVHL